LRRETITVPLAVIGAGPGGYAAAFLAADLGLDVTLIDPEPNPGGVCLYRGCIPSKALLHVARLLGEARDAERWGVRFSEPEIDLARLRGWKSSVVERLTAGLGQVAGLRKVGRLQGRARFLDSSTLEVEEGPGAVRRLSFDHAIVATGSRPATLPLAGASSSRILDSTSALDLKEIPKRLLVIGGGYIGLEMGSVYAALGSRVTVVEMESSLLPGVDSDLVAPLRRRLEGSFQEILIGTRVARFHQEDGGKGAVKAYLEGKDIGDPERSFDRVLVAVGRRPNSEGLGLEQTRVETDGAGFIRVDEQLQTRDARIFAIGDVVGGPMLAHKASHEGRTAVEVIAGRSVIFRPRAIPAVVYTDPEIAWCGLTEAMARTEGRPVRISRFPWAASGRAMTQDRTDGVTKLVIDPDTERILGVGITGSGAGELIAEGVLAVEMAALASDLRLSIHPHPTLSETLMEAAEVFFGTSTHLFRRRKD
jgi:dihydrolipoyl dehydrogenase